MRALTAALTSAALLTLTGCPPPELAEGAAGEAADAGRVGEQSPDPVAEFGAYPIVDTGQSACFGTAGQIDCADGALAGQDAQYQGNAPRYTLPGDGTVVDEVTGLVWTQAHLGKTSFTDAWDVAQASDIGGYDDWRVPTIKELYSLMDFDGTTNMSAATSTPYIDTDVFEFEYGDEASGERFIDAQFWSATEYVHTTMDGDHTVFGVNFADGRIKGYGTRDPRGDGDKVMFLRLVRGNPAYGVNNFEATALTVVDHATGLEWMRDDAGEGMDWPTALAYCEDLELDGQVDWRLPNAKELQSILDYGRSPQTTNSAAIDPVFNVTDIQTYYWTSTTHKDGPEQTWGTWAAYVCFGQAFGYMQGPGAAEPELMDVHGAGAQRGDPKVGDPAEFEGGHGPQGDDVRIFNGVRCVRGGAADFEASPAGSQCGDDCLGGGEAPANPDGEDPFNPGGDMDEGPGGEGPGGDGPPAEAIAACDGLREGAECTVQTPNGELSGTCTTVPEGDLACVPAGGPPRP